MTSRSIRHLRPSDYRVMPWKNGGGTTTELIIEPAGATLDSGFHWRLSMAEVGVSGPFSRFEGYDRTLLLLDGAGMNLEIEGHHSLRLEGPLQPVSFSGDWTTSGFLVKGPCRDFNVITQRAHCHHRLSIHWADSKPVVLPEGGVRFVFCVSGQMRIEPIGANLGALELVRLEGIDEPLRASAAAPGTIFLLVGIDPAR